MPNRLPIACTCSIVAVMMGILLSGAVWATGEKETAVAPSLMVDGVAAHVGEKAITVSEVMGIVQPMVKRLSASYRGDELKQRVIQAYQDGLNLAIERRLILNAYEKQENKIPEWVFRNRADAVVSQSFDGDRDALLKALGKDGMGYDEWLKSIREQVIISSMRREFVDSRVRVGPSSVKEAYETNRMQYAVAEQVHVRLLTMGKGTADAEVRERLERIESIRKEAAAGKDFASLAKLHSEHRTRDDGGNLGWIDPQKAMRRELADAVSALRAGEVSTVIEMAGDYYLLKVEGRREGGVQPFEAVQADIERELRRRETESVYKTWTALLQRGIYISRSDVDPFR